MPCSVFLIKKSIEMSYWLVTETIFIPLKSLLDNLEGCPCEHLFLKLTPNPKPFILVAKFPDILSVPGMPGWIKIPQPNPQTNKEIQCKSNTEKHFVQPLKFLKAEIQKDFVVHDPLFINNLSLTDCTDEICDLILNS